MASITWQLVSKIERLNNELKVIATEQDKLRIKKAVDEEKIRHDTVIEIARLKAEKVLEVARVEAQKVLEIERLKAERLIDLERVRTHQSTMMATYHYLNNALNQFQLVLLHLETTGTVDLSLVADIKSSINKTAFEMREFGQLENPTRENVEKFIQERL